jgi:hypothetical protein
MPTISFRKGPCCPDIPPQALTKGVVPPLLMGGFTGFFAHAPMGFCGERGLRGVPKVAVTGAAPKRRGNSMPQAPTGSSAVIADNTGENVFRPAQQHRPQPPLVHAFPYKTPGFIDFQHVIGLRFRQRLLQRGQGVQFFLIQAANVFRATPKMRLLPRILGRS